ncbi:hypothetical protein ACJZ2D_011819 [Fusarium nematophilum]
MSKTFVSTLREWASLRSTFFGQVVDSATMMIAVFAREMVGFTLPGVGMHALVLGFLTKTLKFTLGYKVGSALNPAPEFGSCAIAYGVD